MRVASQERVYGYIKILQDSSDKPARLAVRPRRCRDEPISGDMPTHLGEVDSLIDVVPSTEKHYSSHWTEVKSPTSRTRTNGSRVGEGGQEVVTGPSTGSSTGHYGRWSVDSLRGQFASPIYAS
ncbi:hypothetical protein HZH66_011058 [Vespula vulgaris]|uniref:Uncharacterized protein n=1 Tax=Vespula vulgaris TaxID=7454 RepID=A0A834JF77_VESVU|nr:hypothetical protein HZH66_011058 [Vespula vulgaris]